MDPQQTPHSTTTGTAGTLQQSAQQQQPLLPYWKFNLVKIPTLYKCHVHLFIKEIIVWVKHDSLYIFTFRTSAFTHIDRKVQQSDSVYNPPGPTAIVFHMNESELQTLLLHCCGLFTDDGPRAKQIQEPETAKVLLVSHLYKTLPCMSPAHILIFFRFFKIRAQPQLGV